MNTTCTGTNHYNKGGYTDVAFERLKIDFPFLTARFIKAAFQEHNEDFIPTFNFLSRINPEKDSNEKVRSMAPFYRSNNSVLLQSSRSSGYIEELQPNIRLFTEVASKLFLFVTHPPLVSLSKSLI